MKTYREPNCFATPSVPQKCPTFMTINLGSKRRLFKRTLPTSNRIAPVSKRIRSTPSDKNIFTSKMTYKILNEINNTGFSTPKAQRLLYKFIIKVLLKVTSDETNFPSREKILRVIDQMLDMSSIISLDEYLSFLSSYCRSRDLADWRGVAIYLIVIFCEKKVSKGNIADCFKITEACVWKRIESVRQNRTYYNSHFRLNKLIDTISSWKSVEMASISGLISQKSKLSTHALYNLNLFVFIQRLESQTIFCIFSLIWKNRKLRFQYFNKLNEMLNLIKNSIQKLNNRLLFPLLKTELDRLFYTKLVCDLRSRFREDPDGFISAFNTTLRKI